MEYTREWIGKSAAWLCAGAMAVSLVPDLGNAATAKSSSKKKKPVRISGSQLYRKLDSIDKALKKLAKQQTAMPAPAPAAMKAPAGDIARAYYNHGIYKKQAAQLRMTAHLIRGIAILGGGAVAAIGWEKERDKVDRLPRSRHTRTIHNSYQTYPWFSYGISTAVLGVTIGYIVDLVALSADKKAAKALMDPAVAGTAGR